jgi:hypothetical protein
MSKLFNPPYYNQSNNPDDLYRDIWNDSQKQQQHRLGLVGSSWSQPPWSGFQPIIGAGLENASRYHPRDVHNASIYRTRRGDPTLRNDWFQHYAQDGDSGFFKSSLFGRGEPIGSNFPMNQINSDYSQTSRSVQLPNVEPIVEPSPKPNLEELEVNASSAEHQQRATHVPPYSQTVMEGLGRATHDEKNVLYSEPFEIPPYKGFLHKKKSFLKK